MHYDRGWDIRERSWKDKSVLKDLLAWVSRKHGAPEGTTSGRRAAASNQSLATASFLARNLLSAAGLRFLLTAPRPKPANRRRKTIAFFGAWASLSLLK
jgi:hypothetical protein